MVPIRQMMLGDKYGKWEVIGRDITRRTDSKAYWLCKCECGNVRSVSGSVLRRGASNSCGCGRKDNKANIVDIVGHKFNRLTVIRDSEERQYGAVLWTCLCECGNYTRTTVSNLKGNTKSCGCLNREQTAHRNKTNIKHGLYKTQAYRRACNFRRAEMKRRLDSQWTYLMEICIRKYFISCVVCNAEEILCTDHVRPLSKGYGLCPGNVVILCNRCNSAKKDREIDKLPIEWQEKILVANESFRVAWSGGF